jgi:hypothetical protein
MSQSRRIEIIGQEQSAIFANEFHIMHTPNDFVLSVVEVIPQMQFSTKSRVTEKGTKQNLAKVSSTGIVHNIVGRFGMSPAAFKKMVTVMNKNLQQYEDKFGSIAINPPEGLQ